MTALVIIFIILVVVILVQIAEKDKAARNKAGSLKVAKETTGTTLFRLNTQTSQPDLPKQSTDDSIIDITGNRGIAIPGVPLQQLVKYTAGVPFWKHHYTYSFNEINQASPEQLNFYNLFKSNFLNGIYFDLEGNSNYAFILLFDLLDYEYKNHNDLLRLKDQLGELGKYYPVTYSYTQRFYEQKVKRVQSGMTEGVSNNDIQNLPYYQTTGIWSPVEYGGFGTKYKSEFNLKDEEVALLNKLLYYNNVFCNLEYCRKQILKLFLAVMAMLNDKLILEGTTREAELKKIIDLIAKNQFNYSTESSSYPFIKDYILKELYDSIMKCCENAVREKYEHKRRISIELPYSMQGINEEWNARVMEKVKQIILSLEAGILPPDQETEIELNALNTGRWKLKWEEIKTKYGSDSKTFFSEVKGLGMLNEKNPMVENIFFEASKYIAGADRQTALNLYLYYIHYDLRSEKFDNRQFTITIQKKLFQNDEQLHNFGVIINDLIKTKDLEKALRDAAVIYKPKRKKIVLDPESIKKVQAQDSGAVELLNEYLADDTENETGEIKRSELNNDEIKIQITHGAEVIPQNTGINSSGMAPEQLALLEYFAKHNGTVPNEELETFARSKAVFKDQLVESVNECSMEKLDDILIEQEGENYIMNQDYYQKLLSV